MIMFIKYIAKLGHVCAEVNVFAQFLNDYATLKIRHKRMYLGLEMEDLSLKCDFSTLLGMLCAKYGTDKARIDKINLLFDK